MMRAIANLAVLGALTVVPLGSCASHNSTNAMITFTAGAHGVVRDGDNFADWSCNAPLREATCSYLFDKGVTVTVHAVPAYGYRLAGWSGSCSGAAARCSFPVTKDEKIAARFVPGDSGAGVTVSAVVQGEGTVAAGNTAWWWRGHSTPQRYFPGQVIELTAVPAVGEEFVRWTGDCDAPADGNLPYNTHCQLELIQDARTVGAVFTSHYPAKAPAEGGGGGGAGGGGGGVTTPKSWGVAEDASKHDEDGGARVYAELATLGMTLNRWTLAWNGSNADGSTESSFLNRALAAKPSRVQVILSLFPDPGAFVKNADGTRQAPSAGFVDGFCTWAGRVAARYKGRIDRYIVLNEPNLATYWPTTDRARTVEQTLAACYDTIKAASPGAQVIGLGLSARSPSAASTAPIDLISQVGAIYKASGRSAPLFDALAVHPYPPQDRSLTPTPAPTAPAASYSGTKTFYGVGSLGRVKAAVNTAFAGTGQKTVAGGLRLVVDEYGYQVNMQGDGRYTGNETSSTVDAATQAADYATAINRYLACDADVSDVLLFHLVDEWDLGSGGLGGWQSGLETIDRAHRPSFDAVAAAIAKGCTSQGPTFP